MFEPLTDTNEDSSRDITKTITEISFRKIEVIENTNNQLLETMNDRGIIAFYLMSPLSIITNPEKTLQFQLVKDSNSE